MRIVRYKLLSELITSMKQPNTPSISPSEPEIEKTLMKEAMEKISNDNFAGIKINLPYLKQYLHEHNLDTDSNGFIIDKESGEYSTAYIFVEDLISEYVKDDEESIFDAFFRPVTDERVHSWSETRVHITDLHSVITTSDGCSHPIKDDSFDIAKLHAHLETGFKFVMGWSDLIQKDNIDENGQWLAISKDPFGSNEQKEEMNLNCLNPECGYNDYISNWNGNQHTDPECPDCGGKWNSEGISVCTICENWYWGTNFEGESIYAEPVCANCGADMEYIERVSRYDEVDSLEQIIENNKPKYSVVGLNDEGDVEHTFNHCHSKNKAIEQKEIFSDTINEINTVEIQKLDTEINISKHEH